MPLSRRERSQFRSPTRRPIVSGSNRGAGRDAQLSRQRLHHGVALIAGLVQNQKIIGVGSVLVVSSTAPSVLRALMAAGTPEISTFLYILPHARPVPVKSGVDGGPRNGEWRVAREEWRVASEYGGRMELLATRNCEARSARHCWGLVGSRDVDLSFRCVCIASSSRPSLWPDVPLRPVCHGCGR